MSIVASHLAKFLEDPCLILWGNPDSRVSDRNLHRTISLPCFNSNPSSLRRELHCIGKQVEKNLFDLPLVTHEVPKTLVDRDIESDAVHCSPFPNKGACVVDGQCKI